MYPPPPNLPSPHLITLPTMLLMIAITLCLQGLLIGISSRVVRSYQGVREASLASLSLAMGFLVIVLTNPPKPAYAAFVSFLLMSGFCLFYLAICRFVKQGPNRWFVLGVYPAGAVGLVFFTVIDFQLPVFLYIRHIAGVIFMSASAHRLLTSDHRKYRLSAYVTAVPIVLYVLVLVSHMVAGFFSIEEVLPGPSISEFVSGLALFIFSFIWTAGFILMVSQRLQSSLNDMAMNDSLTQVHNRRAMDRMLDAEMARVHQEVVDFSIIMMDIDRFKAINDSYGHEVGDRVLQWFASMLQTNLRHQDVVARWGGEEFLILLPDTPVDEAVRIADRLRSLIASEKIDFASETVQVTFSAGIASSTTNRDVQHLCRVADQALYEAKQTRNRVVTLDTALAPA